MTAIKHIVSIAPTNQAEGDEERWCVDNEIIVPAMPVPVHNLFVAPLSGRVCYLGIVTLGKIDVNALYEALAERYPGVPPKLHENYIIETIVAANKLKEGERVSVISNQRSASIMTEENEMLILWENQPIK